MENLSLLSLLGELTFILQGSVRVLIPGCSLLDRPLPHPKTELISLHSVPKAACAVSKMG